MYVLRDLPDNPEALARIIRKHMLTGNVRVAVQTTVEKPLDQVLYDRVDPDLLSKAMDMAIHSV